MAKRMKLPNSFGSIEKLSGNRRNPFMVRKTVDWVFDAEKNKVIQKRVTLGYARTYADAYKMLAEFNECPFDASKKNTTLKEVYDQWSKENFPTFSKSSIIAHKSAIKKMSSLYDIPFSEIHAKEFQKVFEESNCNYPMLKKMKVLVSHLSKFAIFHEITNKDYSSNINIKKHSKKNPNKHKKVIFKQDEIDILWKNSDDKYIQIILILIYTGLRLEELRNLKMEHINFEEHCFSIIDGKTENSIRTVPIADKIYPFFLNWANDNNEYLIHTPNGKHFKDRNYRDSYWQPFMDRFNMDHTPHECRHTCVSLLTKAEVNGTLIKKIVGHRGAMSLTEKVYTHLDVKELLDAINKIS